MERVSNQPIDDADIAAVERQLGRTPRDIHAIAHRCACGAPDVVATQPRLSDGTPFPTFYYATCPRLTGAISTLEGSGVMAQMSEELERDPQLADHYRRAHESYLADRAGTGIAVPEIEGISAGGMPTRVKCLHVLVAHSLAAGPGVNPLGDRALEMLQHQSGPWWSTPCTGAS